MKSVIVKDKIGAVDILKDYIGHTLKDVRYSEGTHVEQLDGEILLEFDEPVEQVTPMAIKANNDAMLRQMIVCQLFPNGASQ